jgi:hypothetical protein
MNNDMKGILSSCAVRLSYLRHCEGGWLYADSVKTGDRLLFETLAVNRLDIYS